MRKTPNSTTRRPTTARNPARGYPADRLADANAGLSSEAMFTLRAPANSANTGRLPHPVPPNARSRTPAGDIRRGLFCECACVQLGAHPGNPGSSPFELIWRMSGDLDQRRLLARVAMWQLRSKGHSPEGKNDGH